MLLSSAATSQVKSGVCCAETFKIKNLHYPKDFTIKNDERSNYSHLSEEELTCRMMRCYLETTFYICPIYLLCGFSKVGTETVGWFTLVQNSCSCYQNTDLRNQGWNLLSVTVGMGILLPSSVCTESIIGLYPLNFQLPVQKGECPINLCYIC